MPGPEESPNMTTNIGDNITRVGPNITGPNQSINVDAAMTMASVLECMILQQSTYHIPTFDGKTPKLKEFLLCSIFLRPFRNFMKVIV